MLRSPDAMNLLTEQALALAEQMPREPFLVVLGPTDAAVVMDVAMTRVPLDRHGELLLVLDAPRPSMRPLRRALYLDDLLPVVVVEKALPPHHTLTERDVTVHGRHGTFQRRQRVRAGEDGPAPARTAAPDDAASPGHAAARKVESGQAITELTAAEQRQLMDHLEPTIRSAVRSVISARPSAKPMQEDLEQEGRLTVYQQLRRNKTNIASLPGYVRKIVMQHARRAAQSAGMEHLSVPSSGHQRMMRKVMAVNAKLRGELEREPTDREIAERLQITPRMMGTGQKDLGGKDPDAPLPLHDTADSLGRQVNGAESWVKQFREGAQRASNPARLDAPAHGGDDGPQTALREQIATPIPGPGAAYAEKEKLTQMRTVIGAAMAKMKPAERQIVEMLHGTGDAPGMERDEVIDALIVRGASEEAARKQVAQAVSNLRDRVKQSKDARRLAGALGFGEREVTRNMKEASRRAWRENLRKALLTEALTVPCLR